MQALKGFKTTDLAIMFMMFLHAICAIITGTTLVGIIATYGLSNTEAGSIETLRNCAIIFVLLITVRLLKIFSAKTLLVVSRLGIAAGYVVSALVNDYTFFLVGVAISGLGAGFLESLIAQTITNLHKGENNVEKFFNLIQSVFSIAVIVVPLGYGYAMEHGVAWQTLFLYTAILPVLVAIVLQMSNIPVVVPEEGGYTEAVKKVFSNHPGRLFSLGIIIAGGLEAMFYLWSAAYISAYLNDNQQYATVGLALFGLFMFVARFVNGILPGKKAVYYMMFMACGAGVISSCLMFFTTGLMPFYIALAFAGLTVGPLWPSLTGLVCDHVPDAKAGYFMIIAIMGIAGYAAAPAITGFIGDVSGNLKMGFILLPLAIGALIYVVCGLKKLAVMNGGFTK